ncbi:MAG: SBBP repeat-containing protein [Limisphaerales bacterium]
MKYEVESIAVLPRATASRPTLLTLLTLWAALVGLGPGVMGQGASGGLSSSHALLALPLAFEPVGGQGEFLARGPSFQFRIDPAGVQLVLARAAAVPGAPLADRGRSLAPHSTTARALRMEFAGANPRARTSGDGAMAAKINYLLGSDPGRWRTGVGTYAKVRVEELYPGVGLVYYGNQQRLEYDFSVEPGTDPGVIAMHFEGVDRLALDEAGDLVLRLGSEEIRQPRPVIYQDAGGQRRRVSGGYVLKDARTVSFAAGSYDRSIPLVIDPTMIYSTYFGGNGNDIIWSVKVNPADQSVYFAGQTLSSQFPITLTGGGAYPTNAGGTINGDAFVARVDSTGTNLLFFTFVGGSGDDGALDLALDSAGNAYITGFTDSTNFPCAPAGGVPGLANSTNISGTITPAHVYFTDGFVAEVTSDGSALVFSSYLGGSDRDMGLGIALDPNRFIYVTGYTYSTNFPTTNALVAQPLYSSKALSFANLSGSNDVFVTKFAPAGAGVVYSTYLGGTNFDVGQGIAADSEGNAYVTGYTASTNFPTTAVLAPLLGQLNDTTNAVRKFHGGAQPRYDAFVAKIAPEGSELLYCAYLGGTNNDSGYRIRLDDAGGVYVAGSSYSADFPIVPLLTTNIVPHGMTNIHYINSDAFLTKIVATDNVPVIQYSLLFGGPLDETAWDLALDPVTTNIFIVGTTTSTNFPAFPLSATNAPFLQATNYTRSNDVFVAAFRPVTYVGTNFFLTNAVIGGRTEPVYVAVVVTNVVLTNLYAVMFGGLYDDFGLGIDVDRFGNAFVCGQTLSGQFPVLNPLQPTLVGHSAGFLAKVQFADELAAVTVDTAPPNLLVAVDGVTNAAPVLTNWVFGSGHNLSAIPVEGGTLGTRYVWTSWSNGGLISNQVSPSSPITNYVARFTTQYLLTMEAAPGGGVNPGSSWYDAGTVVSIAATPGVGSSFAGWSGTGAGGFSGPSNPATVTMSGPITEVAGFTGTNGSVLRVVVNGPGTVSPNLDGKSLQVGQRYQMTAIPNPGYLFAGWSGDVSTNSPALSFVMASGLVLEASFVASPFAAAAGTYTGLFFDTNNLDIESSGLFTATLAANGACSASVRPGNKGYSVSRQFSTNGTFYGVIVRSSVLSPLQVQLQLDPNSTNRMTGQVSDGRWTADIVAYRPVYSTANPAPEKGRNYILRIPGSANSLAAPGGDGFGTITVDVSGNLLLSGTLGDGTKVTQTSFVTGSGVWPLYASLYSGRGFILGWLSFTGSGLEAINGQVTWFKWPNPGWKRLYPGGYTYQTEAVGSVYAFTNGTRALNFSQGQVVIESGGLPHNLNLTNQVLLSAANTVTDLTLTNHLTLSINPASGLFQGSFYNYSNRLTVPFHGALLPSLTNGTGYFVTTNQSGRVFFGP